MPMYFPPWDTDTDPTEANIKIWMDNIYGKFEPLEQARWNQSNIDTLFYAGEQRFINSYFNFYPQYNFQTFHFNFLQQPINMVTGYQRQHRKSLQYLPVEPSKQGEADDMTKLITFGLNHRNILEKMSTAYEQSAISGMVLVQPYLDYIDDPINGTLDLKVWSYNSFMMDPYFREPDASDANFFWCQQYVSKRQAISYFPDKADLIRTMSGYGNRYGKFYFLPENYNLARHDFLVLSYIWYKSSRKKKLLYSKREGINYEYYDEDPFLNQLIDQTQAFEVIEVDVPTWKLSVVLNESVMYNGNNPLGFDECPLVPVFWNYDPHVAQYDLRVRSLTRAMRDSQFLLNRRVILNHDISESSINSGWMRKENAVANPEDLRYAGQGKDIIIKDGYEMTDIQKIIPNAVPPSDMELANQLSDFIFKTSGVNQELMGMANDSKAGIEVMLRQGAGLVTLQKYFDQWDVSLKLVGRIYQKIIQRNWSNGKISRIIGKRPSPEFEAKLFTQFDVSVAEAINTPIQQYQQFSQMLQLREIIPFSAKQMLKYAPLHGKEEFIQELEANEKQAAQMQQESAMFDVAIKEAQLQNLQAKAASELATARERHGRAESNIGLFEERLSEISQNRSQSLKAKVEALEKLLSLINTYGALEAGQNAQLLQSLNQQQIFQEDIEKADAKRSASSNDELINMMQNKTNQNTMQFNQARSALL